MRNRKAAALIAGSVITLTTICMAPAASAAEIKIGVAPAGNGLVMYNQPTSIAVSGVKGKAKVYVYDAAARKYFLAGLATDSQAVPYTFKTTGVIKLKVVPTSGPSKTASVGVYERWWWGNNTPTLYGGTIIDSRTFNETISLSANRGCVLVDVGLKRDRNFWFESYSGDVSIISTCAAPFNLHAPNADGAAALSIPVAGDTVIRRLDKGTTGEWGVRTTCLFQPG